MFIILTIFNLIVLADRLNVKNQLNEIKLLNKNEVKEDVYYNLHTYEELYEGLNVLTNNEISKVSIADGIVSLELHKDGINNAIKTLEEFLTIWSIDYLDDEVSVILGGTFR